MSSLSPFGIVRVCDKSLRLATNRREQARALTRSGRSARAAQTDTAHAEQRRARHGIETFFLSADATDASAAAVAARENASRMAGERLADEGTTISSLLPAVTMSSRSCRR